jgi:competence protein ComEA
VLPQPNRLGRHRRPRPPGPRILTLPRALQGARVSGPAAAALGMALVVVVAAVVLGVRVAWAKASSAPERVGSSAVSAGGGSALASRASTPSGFGSQAMAGGTGSPGGVPSGPQQLVVHVVGQVKRPGVVLLRPGARVRDAVAKAGGTLPGADLAAVNLARVVVDGEQVRVPRPGEAVSAPDVASSGSDGAGAPGGAGGLVNLNTASESALEELPGVGPVLAQRIIDWRTEHGRFTSVDELAEVSGIGEKMFAQLQGKVTV